MHISPPRIPSWYVSSPAARKLLRSKLAPRVALPVLLSLPALLAVVTLSGCGVRTSSGLLSAPTPTDVLAELQSTSTAVSAAPTAPAVPTAQFPPAPPAPTLTAEAALTVIPVPTEIVGLEATHIARATASPFPNTGVEAVGTVQPGGNVVAAVHRAGLSLELRLAGDPYLAGENGRAEITLRNDSSTTLFGGSIGLEVQDEAGRSVDPWPMMSGPRGGWPGQNRFGWMLRTLEPGQSISETLTFQMPALDVAQGHTYTAQATAQFSRADIQHPDRSDNVPADVQTAPVRLRVDTPTAGQHLKAVWQANRQGYTLRVTDADGSAVAGVVWGAIEVDSGRGSMSGPLPDSVGGTWSSGWAEDITQDGTPLNVRAWVAARGYLPATVEQMVPGTGTEKQVSPPVYTAVPTVAP